MIITHSTFGIYIYIIQLFLSRPSSQNLPLSPFLLHTTNPQTPKPLRKCSGHLEEVDATNGLPCAWRDLGGLLQNDDKATDLTNSLRGKRQVARRAGSTYAPEFLGLLEVALMKDSWEMCFSFVFGRSWFFWKKSDWMGGMDWEILKRWPCNCLLVFFNRDIVVLLPPSTISMYWSQ